jgi:uncharacterized damage-inducible protein DinB
VNTILQDLIEHHIWANETLVTYCESLTPDQLALTVPGTFGSVEATIVHLAANEEHYLALADAGGTTTGITRTIFSGETPRELGSLGPVLAKTGDAWRALVRQWPENRVLNVEWEGETVQLPLSVLVTQVVDHGVEHRTHIRTILATHGVAEADDEGTTAPNLDGWRWDEVNRPRT